METDLNMATPGTSDGAARDRAVLVKRAIVQADRPLMTWKDPAILLWLACGVVLAPMPRSVRSAMCRLAARFAAETPRARQARTRMIQMLKLSAQEANHVVRELQSGRLAAYLDVVRSLLLGPDFRVRHKGLAYIATAQRQGRGAILWISDFVSAGDVSKVALASEGLRIAHLSRSEHGFSTSKFAIRFLNPLRVKFEGRFLAERVVFNRTNPAPAMSRLQRVLHGNGIVSIMASMHEGGTLADLPFFDARLKLSVGALRLALVSGAPVMPVFVLRDPAHDSAFQLIVGAPLTMGEGPREHRLLGAAREYASELEAFVRARPESWVGWRRAGQLLLK
jgi:lauroyl/myristoyl acyltransferase